MGDYDGDIMEEWYDSVDHYDYYAYDDDEEERRVESLFSGDRSHDKSLEVDESIVDWKYTLDDNVEPRELAPTRYVRSAASPNTKRRERTRSWEQHLSITPCHRAAEGFLLNRVTPVARQEGLLVEFPYQMSWVELAGAHHEATVSLQ